VRALRVRQRAGACRCTGKHALERHWQRNVRLGVHPVAPERERVRDARNRVLKARARVAHAAARVLRDERAAHIVDVARAARAAVAEVGVQHHDGAAVREQRDLVTEGRAEVCREQGQGAQEQLMRERDGVVRRGHGFERRDDGRVRVWVRRERE
jgi:hypothetical protein